MAHTFPRYRHADERSLESDVPSAGIAIEADLHLEAARVSHTADGGRWSAVTGDCRATNTTTDGATHSDAARVASQSSALGRDRGRRLGCGHTLGGGVKVLGPDETSGGDSTERDDDRADDQD